MKIIIYSLLDIDDYIKAENTNRVLTLFHRIRCLQEAMIHMFSLLDTMSPKEYQEIRVNPGNGSGQESPGFRTLIKMGRPLWDAFKTHYLDKHNLTLKNIYDDKYSHCDAYVVAEAMASYDEMFQRFRYHHLQHIQRSIGLGSKSLKGRPVELLKAGLSHRFFPDLWNIRDKMTDQWSTKYGDVRDSLRSL